MEKLDIRTHLEAAIEKAIALLDELDGDCDREDTGDYEPYLSAGTSRWTTAGVLAGQHDLEFVDEREPEDAI